MPRIANPKPPVALHAIDQPLVDQLHAEGHRAYKALAVLFYDRHVRAFLEGNDRKALEQAEQALTAEEGK